MSLENKASLEFRSLPLMEVTVRMILTEAIPDFGFEFLAKIHEQLKAEFPLAEAIPAYEAHTADDGSLHSTAIRALTFLPKVPGIILRIQNDMIACTWAKTEDPNGSEYPRFEYILHTLASLEAAIQVAGESSMPQVKITNLTYLNFVDKTNPLDTVGTFFRREVIGELFDGALDAHAWTCNFRNAKGRDLFVDFRPAQVDIGEELGVKGFLLKTSGGAFVNDLDVWNVIRDVHSDLQGFFLKMITDEAKERWSFANNN